MAERAFRTMKDTIEIRPIHHHLETRVRAHVFLCMLAYYVSFELHQRLPELLFTDDTPLAPADPVKPATRSPSAHKKAGSATTPTGTPRTPSPTSSPTSARSAATPSASATPSTPSPASPHPPRYKPTPSNYSTSNSTSSQSQTSPQHPNPAPTRGIRHFTVKTSASQILLRSDFARQRRDQEVPLRTDTCSHDRSRRARGSISYKCFESGHERGIRSRERDQQLVGDRQPAEPCLGAYTHPPSFGSNARRLRACAAPTAARRDAKIKRLARDGRG
jgi:hypothetical protein